MRIFQCRVKHFLVWLLAASFVIRLCAVEPLPQIESPDERLAEYNQLLVEWREQKGNDELRRKLIDAAVHADQPETVEEVAAGGDVAGMEIKLPADARRMEIKMVRNLGEMPEGPFRSDTVDCVIRRMTQTRFEAWTPTHGWLFDSKGRFVNEARPPRHGGRGREWHWAFLPDGSWVTTDLWEMDKMLTFFSPKGKWLKEMSAIKLVPPVKDDCWNQSLIGWARCDKRGLGWVVSVGEGPGRGRVFVTKRGRTHLLENDNAPWKLCYPRDLEPKGMYTALSRPSDNFKSSISFNVPSHGSWVGYPIYSWNEMTDGKVIPDGSHNFGFLPSSYSVFICTGWSDPEGLIKTWFFNGHGKCRGWISAEYLADSADGKNTCYRDKDDCVVTLGSDLKPRTRTRFVIDGTSAKPVKIFTDVRLGFFMAGKQLILARW